MLSARDIGWIAGFLEGEGCFYARRDSHGSVLNIQAPQVQRDPLERLQGLVGGQIYKRADGPFVWNLTKSSESAGLMMTLYSLLSPKRQAQIRRCLEVWRTPRRSHSRVLTSKE